MKKLFIIFSLTVSILFMSWFTFCAIFTATGNFVRYDDYIHDGQKMKMESQDFHSKYHLYGNKGYKTIGIHYEFHNKYQELKKQIQKQILFGYPLGEFEFSVPINYNPKKQMDSFEQMIKQDKLDQTYYFHELGFNSCNFPNPTNKLIPGKTYKIKIFPLQKNVTGEDCLAFLRKQNAILVGAQGLLLVWTSIGNHIEAPFINNAIVSYDEKYALWNWEKVPRVPYLCLRNRTLSQGWEFSVVPFDLPVYWWENRCCLLSITKK